MKRYLVIAAALLIVASCNNPGKINLNREASFTPEDTLSINPLLEKVLTTSVNTKDSSMSTLYANSIAWQYALNHQDTQYPPGAVLYEVTWQQTGDPVWFGANIPKEIKTVERISYTYNGTAAYELYEGRPLRRAGTAQDTGRVAFITAQKMAISP